MGTLEQIASELQRGEDERVRSLTLSALDEPIVALTILEQGLIAGMQAIGERFRTHEVFLPDVLLAAKAMNAGLAVLEPHLSESDIPSRGKVVIGTVKGDLHDIGKNLVGIMLSGAGFEVIDLGRDVAPEEFVRAAREFGADVIGMSALLTTTMPAMRRVVELLEEQGLTDSVRTVIGGAPVNKEYAREIRADGYSFDAANAVECVRTLVEQ